MAGICLGTTPVPTIKRAIAYRSISRETASRACPSSRVHRAQRHQRQPRASESRSRNARRAVPKKPHAQRTSPRSRRPQRTGRVPVTLARQDFWTSPTRLTAAAHLASQCRFISNTSIELDAQGTACVGGRHKHARHTAISLCKSTCLALIFDTNKRPCLEPGGGPSYIKLGPFKNCPGIYLERHG